MSVPSSEASGTQVDARSLSTVNSNQLPTTTKVRGPYGVWKIEKIRAERARQTIRDLRGTTLKAKYDIGWLLILLWG